MFDREGQSIGEPNLPPDLGLDFLGLFCQDEIGNGIVNPRVKLMGCEGFFKGNVSCITSFAGFWSSSGLGTSHEGGAHGASHFSVVQKEMFRSLDDDYCPSHTTFRTQLEWVQNLPHEDLEILRTVVMGYAPVKKSTLVKLFDQVPPLSRPTTVYRGLAGSAEDYNPNYVSPKGVIHLTTHVGVALFFIAGSSVVPENHLLQIELPTGIPVIPTFGFGYRECEVLLDATRWKIDVEGTQNVTLQQMRDFPKGVLHPRTGHETVTFDPHMRFWLSNGVVVAR